jgi:selenocysteine lyase/cysteine desulfurase
MNFKLETCRVGLEFVDDLPESTDLVEFSHVSNAFGISYEKELTYYDISTGFLVRYL